MKERRLFFSKRVLISLFVVVVILVLLLANAFSSYAGVTDVGADKVYSSGSLKIYIVDDASGAKTSATLKVTRDTAPSRSTFETKSTSWDCSLTVSGTNNHSLKLNQTTVSTKLTSDGYYMIMNFSLSYTQHANYKYSSATYEKQGLGTRLNFRKYAADNSGDSTITTGYVTSNTTRTVNLQVHTSQLGLSTDKQIRYTGNSVTLEYTRPSYTVTFVNGLGTTLKTQSVLRGAAATAPTSPTRTGYTFVGWDKTFSNITAATTVTATWNPNSYDITFDGNGGTVDSSSLTVTYDSVDNNNVKSNIAKREGYLFDGYWTSPSGGSLVYDSSGVAVGGNYWSTSGSSAVWKATSPLTVYAHWVEVPAGHNSYNIMFGI